MLTLKPKHENLDAQRIKSYIFVQSICIYAHEYDILSVSFLQFIAQKLLLQFKN